MNEFEKRRYDIFTKYSGNLRMLVENRLIPPIDLPFLKTYLCPICTRPFSEKSLDQSVQNPLTLEDAPPKALGGKANVLTCKECNNTLGSKVDSHLSNNFRRKDLLALHPNTSFDVYLTNQAGLKVKGKIHVDEFRNLTAEHSRINNNPTTAEDFANSITKEPDSRLLNFNLPPSHIDEDKFFTALLKTAYLMMFQRFGYLFLFEPVYTRVRNQLMEPETPLYNFEDWYAFPPNEVLATGIYVVNEPLMKSWAVSFTLKTKYSVIPVMIFLPLYLPVQYMIKGFNDIRQAFFKAQLKKNLGVVPFEDYQTILTMDTVTFADRHLLEAEANLSMLQSFESLKNL